VDDKTVDAIQRDRSIRLLDRLWGADFTADPIAVAAAAPFSDGYR
jgi:hypothetical protein